jgi:hypothetical protein
MKKSKFNHFKTFVEDNLSTIEQEDAIEYQKAAYDVQYYEDFDEIIVVKYNEDGEIEEFIDTNPFDSFKDTRDLETFQDHWDYERELVYQTYSIMDWDEFLVEYGMDELVEFIHDELKNKEIKNIKNEKSI